MLPHVQRQKNKNRRKKLLAKPVKLVALVSRKGQVKVSVGPEPEPAETRGSEPLDPI